MKIQKKSLVYDPVSKIQRIKNVTQHFMDTAEPI